jgi:hypothetical protein
MSSAHKIRKILYGITLFFITLTGFAQMPIFARYHISDILGFGWLAQFYVTHVIHYIFAVVFIAFCIYVVLDLFLNKKGLAGITASGLVKALIILGLLVSGCFMVFKNLPGVYFSHVTIYILDLSHIILCMALLMASAYTLIKKKAWIR